MNLQRTRFEVPEGHYGGPPDLAHLAAFDLGHVRVVPAERRIVLEDGSHGTLEPLVMQVLVALANPLGRTMSRDDLVTECWGRRIVGDDAVNRVMSRLRRGLAESCGDRVTVETVAKVGYRLRLKGAADDNRSTELAVRQDDAAGKDSPKRMAALAGTAIAGVAIVAAILGLQAPDTAIAMAIEPRGGAAGNDFTSGLTADLAHLAGPMTNLTLIEPGADSSADMVLKVSAIDDSKDSGAVASVRLVDQSNRAVIWSREFVGPSRPVLRERMALIISGVIRCGLHRSSGDLGDPVSRRLYISACDAVDASDWPRAHSFARQIADRRPDSAASWACLALATANLAQQGGAPPPGAAEEAIGFARKALEIDPNSGLAHQAMAAAIELDGGDGFASLAEGVRRDPEHGGLLMRYAAALASMGYVEEAVQAALRANALEPSSFWTAQVALLSLIGSGRLDEARRMSARVRRVWGDSFDTGYTRHAVLFYDPDPVRALARFDRSPPRNPLLAERQRFELAWRLDPAKADWAAFDRNAEEAVAQHPDNAWFVAASSIRMGDRGRAFAWLERARVTGSLRPLAPLFWPDAAELRRDPRFFAKMAETGLIEKWRARGRWPDFCRDADLGYDCEAEAAKIAARRRM